MRGCRRGAGRTAAAQGLFMHTPETIKRTPPTPEASTWPNMFTDHFSLIRTGQPLYAICITVCEAEKSAHSGTINYSKR
jgi:hypothetical protein